MVKTRPLYILVSRTDTGIARLIRSVTHYPYNHVSVTLDPGLRSWYSFARYAPDAPFYGGFIRETPARFLGRSADTQVRLFRVDIPEKTAQELEKLLPLAGNPESGLIYNHFDAAASILRLRVPVPGCHTCLSFAASLLDREFDTIRQLCDALEPWSVYEGALTGLMDIREGDPDFAGLGLVRGCACSAAALGTLTLRTLWYGFDSYKARRFHRTAL